MPPGRTPTPPHHRTTAPIKNHAPRPIAPWPQGLEPPHYFLMKRTNKTKTPTATHHNGTPPTAAPAAPASPPKPKLELTRVFSSPDRHPFEEIEWEQREVAITNDKGKRKKTGGLKGMR